MKIPLVQVDAFTSQVFRGNPAAVCPLESWLDDQTLQSIATENNLSETAFLGRRRRTLRDPLDDPGRGVVDLCATRRSRPRSSVRRRGEGAGRDRVSRRRAAS
jgi:hypothetical protein